MAKLIFSDGQMEYVDYNTAAKVWQLLQDNDTTTSDDERAEITKYAEKTVDVDFKAIKPKERKY